WQTTARRSASSSPNGGSNGRTRGSPLADELPQLRSENAGLIDRDQRVGVGNLDQAAVREQSRKPVAVLDGHHPPLDVPGDQYRPREHGQRLGRGEHVAAPPPSVANVLAQVAADLGSSQRFEPSANQLLGYPALRHLPKHER